MLSAIYLDISKDTMYCDAPGSPTRRCAQTAMYEILRGLVGYLAPILSFTAEEIYEAMPGTKEQSVHLTDFPTIDRAQRRTKSPRGSACSALRDAVLDSARDRRAPRSRSASRSKPTSASRRHARALVGARRRSGEALHRLARRLQVGRRRRPDSSTSKARPHRHHLSPARGKSADAAGSIAKSVEDGGLCARCEKVVGSAPVETPTT